MSNMIHYTEHHMFEYASIFPNTASVLEHILFVLGNGYYIKDGLPADYESHLRIDEYKEKTDADWDKLLNKCRQKQIRFLESLNYGPSLEDYAPKLEERMSRYVRTAVDESMFTEEHFYNILNSVRLDQAGRKVIARPYPIFDNTLICQLNEETPSWFLSIAVNLCKAWEQYLDEDYANGNYEDVKEEKTCYESKWWTLRHKTLISEQRVRLEQLIGKNA